GGPRPLRDQLAEHFPQGSQVLGLDALVEGLSFGSAFGSREHQCTAATACSAGLARRRREMDRQASEAISTGAAATREICRVGRGGRGSGPPIAGPMMDPMRPIPSAQPTPVERIAVGYELAVRAFAPICPPTTPKPAPRTVSAKRPTETPAMPMRT